MEVAGIDKRHFAAILEEWICWISYESRGHLWFIFKSKIKMIRWSSLWLSSGLIRIFPCLFHSTITKSQRLREVSPCSFSSPLTTQSTWPLQWGAGQCMVAPALLALSSLHPASVWSFFFLSPLSSYSVPPLFFFPLCLLHFVKQLCYKILCFVQRRCMLGWWAQW